MMRLYKEGSLEEAIKNLIADALLGEEELARAEEEQDGEKGVKARGKVKDPSHDRRLKENRNRDVA